MQGFYGSESLNKWGCRRKKLCGMAMNLGTVKLKTILTEKYETMQIIGKNLHQGLRIAE